MLTKTERYRIEQLHGNLRIKVGIGEDAVMAELDRKQLGQQSSEQLAETVMQLAFDRGAYKDSRTTLQQYSFQLLDELEASQEELEST